MKDLGNPFVSAELEITHSSCGRDVGFSGLEIQLSQVGAASNPGGPVLYEMPRVTTLTFARFEATAGCRGHLQRSPLLSP